MRWNPCCDADGIPEEEASSDGSLSTVNQNNSWIGDDRGASRSKHAPARLPSFSGSISVQRPAWVNPRTSRDNEAPRIQRHGAAPLEFTNDRFCAYVGMLPKLEKLESIEASASVQNSRAPRASLSLPALAPSARAWTPRTPFVHCRNAAHFRVLACAPGCQASSGSQSFSCARCMLQYSFQPAHPSHS